MYILYAKYILYYKLILVISYLMLGKTIKRLNDYYYYLDTIYILF